MVNNSRSLIFHIDVNSAYLSFEATYRKQHGEKIDLRDIASVIGGDENSRHGIVLAKSEICKKFNIKTGETLYEARSKCKNLVVVPPRYGLYVKCSSAMYNLLLEYTPQIQRFSIDENFLDFSNMEHIYPDYMELARTIKIRIKEELGFTVNIGISHNKLLAKVASDFEKPDRIHTLFKEDIKDKMWKLPVEDLFMVGRATAPKLRKLNILTIGDLANYDLNILKNKFKSHGELIWNYANGIDDSKVRKNNTLDMKSIGNSTTNSFDIEDRETAHRVILSLVETIGIRLRDSKKCCSLVSVHIKSSDFYTHSKQRKTNSCTDCTSEINKLASNIFDELWQKQPIRHIGVSVSELCSDDFCQMSFFEEKNHEKNKELDKAMDSIRMKYGLNSVMRATFLKTDVKPFSGGNEEDGYPLIGSVL